MPSASSLRGPAGDKRLIFTLTTGRSGTQALSRALNAFRDVRALHEPKPTFSSAFRSVCAQPDVAREFWLEHKLPRIARSAKPIYAETSHVACKGFLESLIALGYRPDLIHLQRPAREVAISLWQLATIPGRTYKGVKYYVSPWDARARLALEPGAAERLHDYQLCFWYCLEIAARARAFADEFRPRGIRVVPLETRELESPERVLELGRTLELGPLRATGRLQLRSLSRRPLNTKDDKKRALSLTDAELDALESELRELVPLESRC